MPYRDGTTHVIFEPEDFIARLAALVPKPRAHLTRYHGVFASPSPDRARIISKTRIAAANERGDASATNRHRAADRRLIQYMREGIERMAETRQRRGSVHESPVAAASREANRQPLGLICAMRFSQISLGLTPLSRTRRECCRRAAANTDAANIQK